MKIRSQTTDRQYLSEDMIYITNVVQIAKYLKHAATLYDILEDNGNLVGVFSKKETAPLYKQWQKRELV